MKENFSHLSINDKTLSVSQQMTWTIPSQQIQDQSCLSQVHYPYFTAEFCVVCPYVSEGGVETNWLLILDRLQDKVIVNIQSLNNEDFFERVDMSKVSVKWDFSLGNFDLNQVDSNIVLGEDMEVNKFEFFKTSQSEGRVLCDIEVFDSLLVDVIVEVDIVFKLEYRQVSNDSLKGLQTQKLPSILLDCIEPFCSVKDTARYSVSNASNAPSTLSSCFSWYPGLPYNDYSSCHDEANDWIKEHIYQTIPGSNLTCSYRDPHKDYSPAPIRRSRSGLIHNNSSAKLYEPSADQKCLVNRGQVDFSDIPSSGTCFYIPEFKFSEYLKSEMNSVQSSDINDDVFYDICKSDQEIEKLLDSSINLNSGGLIIKNRKDSCKSLMDMEECMSIYGSQGGHETETSCSSHLGYRSASSKVISCIYTSSINSELSLREKRKLLGFAVENNLSRLAHDCVQSYLNNLQIFNCLETLLAFDSFLPKSDERYKVIVFIRDNIMEVIKQDFWHSFVEFGPDLVNEILNASNYVINI